MIIPVLLYASTFLAVMFMITGLLSLIRLYPVMNSDKTTGRLKDARITTQNVLGEDFPTPKTYVYFTYQHNGVTHGSSSISAENNAFSRNLIKELADRFNKEGAFDIDVYVNKSDKRKAYLQSPESISMKKLFIGIFLIIVSAILYLMV